jgi:hypothetical protein
MGPDELPPYVSGDGEGPPAYVAWADTEVVEVKAASGQLARQLIALGFEPARDGSDAQVRRVAADPEKGRPFATLRDAGVCFSYGREWNPCQIFEWLSEHGWLQGPFFQIAWIGPGKFVVREAT